MMQDGVPGLLASKSGYYKATSKEELEGYIVSLKERKNSIDEIIKALENDLQIF
jgi:hypothetical protein